MNEKALEQKLREKVKLMGGVALKFQSLSFTGMPDRLILLPGARVFFAEVKSAGKKPTTRQLTVHRWLHKLGFTVAVIDSKESLNDFLKMIKC